MADDVLFELEPPTRSRRGRVRRALDRDIHSAAAGGVPLQRAGLASLQVLADQLDDLDADLRSRRPKPYDRLPLAQLQRQFDETYDRVFAAVSAAVDPFLAALDEFRRTEARDTSGSVPPD